MSTRTRRVPRIKGQSDIRFLPQSVIDDRGLYAATMGHVTRPEHVTNLGLPLGTIYIGGLYPNIESFQKATGKHPLAVYHPAHIANVLAHESLHAPLQKQGGTPATRAIDQTRLFGTSSELSPSGMIDFTILQKRVNKRLGR